jgi:MFS family permease
VTAERFGINSLAKLLALIIMGYSVGQWLAPWVVGRLFDTYHSYRIAWVGIAAAAIVGGASIYKVSAPPRMSAPAAIESP